MPVVVYRQPWFWAIVVAVMALLIFGIVIAASGPDRDADSTTIIQQPTPAEDTEIVPVPGAGQPAQPSQPAPPAPPAQPSQPAQPAQPQQPQQPQQSAQPPQVIERETVIIQERDNQPEPRTQQTPPPARQPQPRETDRSATPPPPPGPGDAVIAQDVFQRTGLPKEMRYDDTRWQATRTVTVSPDKRLREAGKTEDGQSIMVSENAQEPFQTVLIATPDDPERYVEYRRR